MALFWTATYALFTLRAALLPSPPFDPLSIKRLVAISVGTLICGAALATLRHTAGRPWPKRAALALLISASGAALLLFVRSGFDDIIGVDDDTLADEARWLLMWFGYYVAWLLLDTAITARPVAAPAASASPVAIDDAALWVHSNQQLVRMPFDAIEWIASEGNYARVHSADASGLLRASLSQLDGTLAPAGFVRLHRSAICRRDRIAAVQRKRTGALIVVLLSGAELPVGRAVGQRLLDEARRRPSS
ncbi:MAG: LytTR family DNA-binding domain-containing protein [Sphingomonadaceae bacterium]|nr:LytTR family DNA-binding domain-containing protein [Sphingomonadaceae bacterium]